MAVRLTDGLAPGMRVFTPTLSNESALLSQHLREDPERARGVEFCGIQFPGIDTVDYLALHPEARQTTCFMGPAVRAAMAQGRACLLGLDYQGMAQALQAPPGMDVAIAQLSAPDAGGWCAPGLACDFLPLVWRQARRRVAHINPLLPRLRSSFRVHVSELDAQVVSEQPLLDFNDSQAGEVEQRVGAHVAALVRDGDTLQFGIGSVPLALAGALTGAPQATLSWRAGVVSAADPMGSWRHGPRCPHHHRCGSWRPVFSRLRGAVALALAGSSDRDASLGHAGNHPAPGGNQQRC